MGGNVSEWTTESCSDTSNPFSLRGGIFDGDFAGVPAGDRARSSDNANAYFGFRVTLFL